MFGETGGWAYALMWLPQLSQYVTHVLVCVLFSHRGTEKGEEELTWNPQGFWYWRRARGTSFTKAHSLDCVSLTYWTDTNPQKGKTHPDSGTSANMEYGSVLATLPAAPGMLLQFLRHSYLFAKFHFPCKLGTASILILLLKWQASKCGVCKKRWELLDQWQSCTGKRKLISISSSWSSGRWLLQKLQGW